jgi:hypothetical protein
MNPLVDKLMAPICRGQISRDVFNEVLTPFNRSIEYVVVEKIWLC